MTGGFRYNGVFREVRKVKKNMGKTIKKAGSYCAHPVGY